MDSNEIFTVKRSDEWKNQQRKMLKLYHEKNLDTLIRKPIVIYDIIERKCIRFKQIKDVTTLIEIKHIRKNIYEKQLIPYKNRYIAILESDYSPEILKKILIVKNENYGAIRTLCNLYNLETGEEKHFGSKKQFSLNFSNISNQNLYNIYKNENILDFNMWCVNKPNNKEKFLNMNLVLRPGKRFKNSKCTVRTLLNALKTTTIKTELSKIMGIGRKALTNYFNLRSQEEWMQKIEALLIKLPE